LTVNGIHENRATLDIGCVGIDSQNPEMIYVGTGNSNNATGGPSDGLGVFRSNAGGFGGWSPTGLDLSVNGWDNREMASARVNKIVILGLGQAVPSRIFAATNKGFFRYIDDGSDRWRLIANPVLPQAEVIDLVMSPSPHNFKMIAAIGGKGLFLTKDLMGENWQSLASDLPAPGTFGRISLAFFAPNIVYAGFQSTLPNSPSYRLFRSIDGGIRWTEILSAGLPTERQLDFNNELAVSPSNPNIIYVGQNNLQRSLDGGSLWHSLSDGYSQNNQFCSGANLHVDIHDVVFAPRGSFVSTESAREIIYVAHDGGVSRGIINQANHIRWASITKGLAIGQCGTVGLNPREPSEFTCGFWHNGTLLMAGAGPNLWMLRVGGGDGYIATLDSAFPSTVYYSQNAGENGFIERAQTYNHVFEIKEPRELIWNNDIPYTDNFLRDPYKQGDLVRLNGGRFYRVHNANNADTRVLMNADSWEVLDPPGKAGISYGISFRPRLFSTDLSLYYIGSRGIRPGDVPAGQIWRGVPENGWEKIFESGSRRLNGLTIDPNNDFRVIATFEGDQGPGRIKEIKKIQGQWQSSDIDTNFNSFVKVNRIAPIAIDPLNSNEVFIGTDIGLYHGTVDNDQWTWNRSPGIPYVSVSNLEFHDTYNCGHYSWGFVYMPQHGVEGFFFLTENNHYLH
jgi:hypothetical protein